MTVQPASLVFRLYQGATFTEPVIIKDSNGVIIDLTGCTAHLQARLYISDTNPILDLTTENGGIEIDGPAGAIVLNIDAITTAGYVIDWDGEIWYCDLLLTRPDDTTVDKMYQGAIVAIPSNTRILVAAPH